MNTTDKVMNRIVEYVLSLLWFEYNISNNFVRYNGRGAAANNKTFSLIRMDFFFVLNDKLDLHSRGFFRGRAVECGLVYHNVIMREKNGVKTVHSTANAKHITVGNG